MKRSAIRTGASADSGVDVVIDSPHEPVDDQDATKALPERDLAFSGHFPRVSPERSGACAASAMPRRATTASANARAQRGPCPGGCSRSSTTPMSFPAPPTSAPSSRRRWTPPVV